MRPVSCAFTAAVLSLGLASAPALAVHPGAEDEDDVQAQDEEEGIGTDSGAPREQPEDRETSVTYSGIGLSRVSTDFENLKEAVNLDAQIGIRVPTINWISAEINIAFTIIPGENTTSGSGAGQPCLTNPSILDPDGTPNGCTPGGTSNPNVTESQNDLQMQNVGVFAVLRSPGRVYAMGKFGYRYLNTSIEEIQEGDDRSGTGYALGAGYRWGKGLSGFELLYAKYSSQLDYIGFNIAYGFGARSRDR